MTPIRSFMKALRSPSLGKVLLALVAVSVTEWAAYIALVMFAFRDGGAARVGQVSIVTLVVAAAVAPIGSVLGDRYRRERALLLAPAALALATGATSVAMFAGWSTLVVVAVAAAAAALLTLIRPTHNALLPYLAETPEELTLAYAATGLIQSVSVLLGPLLATLVFVLAGSSNGPALLLGVLSVLLIVGTALVATLHPIRSSEEVPHRPRRPTGHRSGLARPEAAAPLQHDRPDLIRARRDRGGDRGARVRDPGDQRRGRRPVEHGARHRIDHRCVRDRDRLGSSSSVQTLPGGADRDRRPPRGDGCRTRIGRADVRHLGRGVGRERRGGGHDAATSDPRRQADPGLRRA